jgi:glycosyltransferase involved in cell wall biosynthesis
VHVLVDAVGIKLGGGEWLLSQYFEVLPRLTPEWQWTFVCAKGQLPQVAREGVSVRYLSVQGWVSRFMWLNRQLPREVQAGDIDLVFHFANLASLRRACPQLLFVQQAKLFAGSRNVRQALMSAYFLIAVRKCRTVLVQNRWMKSHVQQASPRAAVEIVDMPVIVNKNPSVVDENKDFTVITYVSQALSHKNHIKLLQGYAQVAEELPKVVLELTVASDHPVISAEVKRLNLEGNVRLLGELDRKEIESLYGRADISVYPSTLESFGLPLVESAISGLPVVASDLPYAHEIMGDDGHYFDPNDPQAIAAALKSACVNLAELKRHAVTVADVYRQRFSPQAAGESLVSHMEEAVK